MIDKILEKQTGLKWIPEHKFLQKRKFRFDFAQIELKIAIEIEGGLWTQGRHTRGKGYVSDMEKYNLAVLQGWHLLRFTPDEMRKTSTYEQINELINNLKNK